MKKVLLVLALAIGLTSCKKEQNFDSPLIKHEVKVSYNGSWDTYYVTSEIEYIGDECIRFTQLDNGNTKLRYESTFCKSENPYIIVR